LWSRPNINSDLTLQEFSTNFVGKVLSGLFEVLNDCHEDETEFIGGLMIQSSGIRSRNTTQARLVAKD
jgi:hypothetical protein